MEQAISWLLVIITGSLSYTVVTIIYRLYFHPLSRFPGPKLAAATGLYEDYFDLLVQPGGQFPFHLKRLHDIYGPVIRINPHEIHVEDSSWIDVLYVSHGHGTRDKYPPAARMIGTPEGGFGTISHGIHQRRRSAISPFFSKAAVTASEPLIHDTVERFLHRINTDILQTGSAELRLNYLALSTDSLLGHCFGEVMNWKLLENKEKAEGWLKTIIAVTSRTQIVKRVNWIIPLALRMPIWPLEMLVPDMARIIRLRHDLRKHASTVTQEFYKPREAFGCGTKSSQNAKRKVKNIFNAMLESKVLLPSEKDPDRMSQEGFEVIVAGVETTSRILTAATYYVLANPHNVLLRLQAELRLAFPDPKAKPTLKQLEHLPWLTAVIKESLRIHTLPTSRLPVVSPKETLQYKDWVFPPGTPIGMTLRDVLLDPGVFHEPEEFRPERWMPENPELERMSRNYLPFSRGSRMCLGINLAMAHLYITLAMVFRRYDFELHDTIWERDIRIVRDCFVGEVSPDTKGVRIKHVHKPL